MIKVVEDLKRSNEAAKAHAFHMYIHQPIIISQSPKALEGNIQNSPMKKLFILAIAAVGLLACNGKNEPESSDNSKNPSASATISCDPTSKTVSAAGGEFTVTITSNAAWSATADKSWVTVSPNSGQGDACVTVTVAAGEDGEANVLFSNGKNSASLIVIRKESDDSSTQIKDLDVLSGAFSVSSGKKVQFAPGNLQYQASTSTWRFAENQYNVIGGGNANISDSYSDWIDLFGWGSGNTPTVIRQVFADYATFRDWGNNKISNGSNKPNAWRTLSKAEWVYLFCNRKNASELFGFASVNGINGLVILPDNWVASGAIEFNSANSKGVEWKGEYYLSSSDDSYLHNTYNVEQWATLESAGAIFLPVTGHRKYTNIEGSNIGYYWSSTICEPYGSGTEDDGGYAYGIRITLAALMPQEYELRWNGRAVRLVRDL